MIQLKHTQPSHDGSNYKLWAILTPCAHPGDRAVCPPRRQSRVPTLETELCANGPAPLEKLGVLSLSPSLWLAE